MRFIKTNKEEVQNVRFLSDHEMVIGNNVWDYESSRGMLEALWLGIRSCLPHCNEFGEFEYFPFADIRQLTPEEKKQATITLEDLFHQALDFFLAIGTPFAGQDIKLVSNQAPAMIMEVYGMQDALFYAIEDFGIDLSEDEIFNNFIAENGYWWIATYIGNSKAEELEREFFDRYFPILKKRLSKEHNTAD